MVESPTRPTRALDDDGHPDLAEDRGSLEVRHRALQRTIEHAAVQIPGTVTQHGALGRLTGSRLPKAEVTAEGSAVRVTLDVAVVWPGSVSGVATAARDTVRREAARLTGVQIRRVDVTVHAVDPTGTDDIGRRVE